MLTARHPARPSARVVAVTALAVFAVLALVVALYPGDPLDLWLRDLARPGNVWGDTQLRAQLVVAQLRPARIVWLPVAVAGVACLRRRSLRPAVMVGLAWLIASAVVIGVKPLVARPDPHGLITSGGSFPSGHTLAAVVCSGLALLLVRPRLPWWAWTLPAVLGGVMGTALVLEGAHWASDVLGGALAGMALLAGVCALGGPRWAAARRFPPTSGRG